MNQRGRKSADALTVTKFAGVTSVQRPDAPYDLTDEQASVWRRVVNALPADWFGPETWGELTSYCRHEVASQRVAQLIGQVEQAESFDVEEYDRLLKMQERESRAKSSLATRLRLTPQTKYEKDKSRKGGAVTKKPWDVAVDD
jgi:phage terminase small subunit